MTRAGTSVMQRLRDTHALLLAANLAPIVDHELCRVLADCPRCNAGAVLDADGIYRPLTVDCSTTPVSVACRTGCAPATLRQALVAPPVDWQAVAEEYAGIAAEALELLDAGNVTRSDVSTRRLEVAA